MSAVAMPNFASLVLNYPTTPDFKSVIKSIRPDLVDNPSYQNTCAMRLCKALNGCPGHQIPKGKIAGLYTIVGIDGNSYAVRVQEMKDYLKRRYAAPSKIIIAAKGVINNADISGKKGIIAFDVSGWKDASGHFTLWDGKKLLYAGSHDYFNLYEKTPDNKVVQVTKCYLWECV